MLHLLGEKFESMLPWFRMKSLLLKGGTQHYVVVSIRLMRMMKITSIKYVCWSEVRAGG